MLAMFNGSCDYMPWQILAMKQAFVSRQVRLRIPSEKKRSSPSGDDILYYRSR